MLDRRKSQLKGIAVGLLLLLLSHLSAWGAVVAVGAVFFSNYSFLWFYYHWLQSMSFWQLVYATPLALWLSNQGYNGTAKGIWVGVIISGMLQLLFSLLF